MPIVIRIPYGGGIGAVEHHSECPGGATSRTPPGLKVVACSNPVDAYWMIQQAIACDDPVIFLEPKRRYRDKAEVDESATPDPLFASRVVRAGHRPDAARLRPDGEDLPRGRRRRPRTRASSVEVIDLRTLSPLDLGARPRVGPKGPAGGRRPRGAVNLGLGAEIAARITEECFYSLEAPVLRVGGFDTPYPPARVEEEYLPDLDRVLDAVDRFATELLRRRLLHVSEFKLPDVGEGLTEAEIVTWNVTVGDTVKVNDVVVEIETAKSLVELPCPYAGTVTGCWSPRARRSTSARRSSRSTTGEAQPLRRRAPAAPEAAADRATWCRARG